MFVTITLVIYHFINKPFIIIIIIIISGWRAEIFVYLRVCPKYKEWSPTPKGIFDRGRSQAQTWQKHTKFSFFWLKALRKMSKFYDNPFWEKSMWRRKNNNQIIPNIVDTSSRSNAARTDISLMFRYTLTSHIRKHNMRSGLHMQTHITIICSHW